MKLPVAIEWVRVSSAAQAEADTHVAQRRALDELLKRRPAQVVERVEALGVSGALPIHARTDVSRVQQLIEAGGVDELRVVALDRITRAEHLADRLHVLMLCERHRVLIVEAGGRVVDPQEDLGQVEFVMRSAWAKQERHRITARTTEGKERCAEAQRLVGWIGFGWRRIPRESRREPPTYEVDPIEGPIVVQMYEWVVEGTGLLGIARELDARGVPTPRSGAGWSLSRVRNIVRSASYRGVHRQSVGGVSYEVPVPRIVSDELWHAAQAALDSRYQARGRPATIPALVRGRVYCARCGSPMRVHAQSRGRGYGPRYRCRTQVRDSRESSCGAPTHPVAAVDNAAWETLRDVVLHSDLLSEADATDDCATWRDQIAQCEKQLAKAQRDERRVLDLLRRDLLTDEGAAQELRRVRAARETAQRTIQVAERALAQRQHQTRVAAELIDVYRPLLDAADLETRRRLVEALVPEGRPHGVWLHPDGDIEIVGVLSAAGRGGHGESAGEGTGTVGRSEPSACSNVNPVDQRPRMTNLPSWLGW